MSNTLHMIDAAYWRAVPRDVLWIVRSYIDSNYPDEQARGRAWCEQYGLDYADARRQVMAEMTRYERARYPQPEAQKGGLL